MSRRRKWLLALSVGLVALCLALLVTTVRRVIKVCWLRAADWLSEAPVPRQAAEGELVVFDATSANDRDALSRSYGRIEVVAVDGDVHLRATGETKNEICTRHLPRDWSGYKVLRLELAQADGGPSRCDPRQQLPLLLNLRIRAKPAWAVTSWYRHKVFLPSGARQHQVSLSSVGQFIRRQNIRQLCLDLPRSATLGLKRMVLSRRWAEPSPIGDTPVAVHIVGESTKLRRFDSVAGHALDNNTVHLQAARGETVALQLVIRRGRGGPETARIRLAPTGPTTITPRMFEARTLVVREPSSAMFGPGSPGPGIYPDPLVPLGPDQDLTLWDGNRLVWLDFTVPTTAAPGVQQWRLKIHLDPASSVERLVQLEVHPVDLPRQPPLFMLYYSPHIVRQALGLSGDAYQRLERDYHRLVHAHGAFLVTDPALENLNRFLPMLDGSLFPDGQGAPYWPVDLKPHENSRKQLQAAAAKTMRWFRRHRLKTKPFVYLADEPSTQKDYLRIRRLADWVHSAPPPGDQLPVMVTEQVEPDEAGWPSLIGSVDYWISPGNFPQPALRRRKETDERFFTYNGLEPGAGSLVIDAPGVSPRTWGWIAHRFAIDVWFYWEATYYFDEHNGGQPRAARSIYRDPLTFDQRRRGKDAAFGNGDGVLVYPPLSPGGRPIPSMRLKGLRRATQDRLLLFKAEQCGQRDLVQKLSRKLLPRVMNDARGCNTSWPRDGRPWAKARRALLKRLAQGCAAR